MIETIGDTLLKIYCKPVSGGWLGVYAEFLHYDTGRNAPRNFTTLSWEVKEVGWDLNGFVLESHTDTRRHETLSPEILTFSSASLRYSGFISDIDIDRAKSMVSTITRIENRLDKFRNELGFAQYWHEHVYRVAKAVGAKSIMSLRGHDSGSYETNSYRYMSITVPHIRSEIDSLLFQLDKGRK